MNLLLDILYSLLMLGGIVVCCATFTNAIEWIGHRFNLSEGAVGSVLAAVGTALPETIVPIVAIISGVMGLGLSGQAGHDIGVGAILGAPFMLGTLAMFVSGLAVLIYAKLGKRPVTMTLCREYFLRDMKYFFPAFMLTILAAFLPVGPMRWVVALALFGVYGTYLYKILAPSQEGVGEKVEEEAHHELDPLWFAAKQQEPPTGVMVAQALAGLAGIVVLAHLFVHEIEHLSGVLGIEAMILSLIIIPIATELPEKFNSVLWLGKQKDNLALGNITGAMVFQSTIPTAIGVLFTPWIFSNLAWNSAILCLLSTAAISILFAWKGTKNGAYELLIGGVFYLLFVILVVQQMQQTAAGAQVMIP